MDSEEKAEPIDPNEKAEPIENAELTEPMLQNEFTDPMLRNEFREPMLFVFRSERAGASGAFSEDLEVVLGIINPAYRAARPYRTNHGARCEQSCIRANRWYCAEKVGFSYLLVEILSARAVLLGYPAEWRV